jgi:MFS superfamily sulfate permease-like transporter
MMQVKIDTKEIFHVICIEEKELPANMAEDLNAIIANLQSTEIKSLIFNMKNVEFLSNEVAEKLNDIRTNIYMQNKSLVICETTNRASEVLRHLEDFESINITPTESEAWDIVQMEEIERELGMDLE